MYLCSIVLICICMCDVCIAACLLGMFAPSVSHIYTYIFTHVFTYIIHVFTRVFMFNVLVHVFMYMWCRYFCLLARHVCSCRNFKTVWSSWLCTITDSLWGPWHIYLWDVTHAHVWSTPKNMYLHIWQFPLTLLHPQNPPNPETQISRYLAIINSDFGLVSIRTEEFEFLDSVDLSVVAFSVETVIPSLSFQRGDLYHSCIHMYVFMFNVLLRAYMHIFWEHSTNSVFTYIISLLPTGGLMLFTYLYICIYVQCILFI